MTIRVLEIIPTLDRGGAEKQLTLLATGLARSEFDVHVCLLTRSGPLEKDLRGHNIPITHIGKSWKVDPLAFRRLRKFINGLQPDIVHSWIFAANCYGRQAAISAGIPHIIAGERCVDPWKSRYELALDRWLARRTVKIATNSSGVKEFYAERGIPEHKFVVIPNGVAPRACQTDRSNYQTETREEVFAELDLRQDLSKIKVIGAVGRLWPQKRYKDLIWAAELLRTVREDIHFIIIGDGPQRWRLERFGWQVGMHGRLHFLGERNDVSRWLPHFDCFWLGSGYEGQSNAMMEAMASGAPVVATDIPGNRDLVLHEETGFLVPVGDRAGFARWTNLLLDDAQLSAKISAAAQTRMASEFTVEKMVQRYGDLYRDVTMS